MMLLVLFIQDYQIKKILVHFKAQLNRCGMTCFDKATQKFGPDPGKYTEIQSKEFDKQLLK